MISTLPSEAEMYDATLRRDASYEGVFILAVKTTGIFCRPTCTARKPNRENVEYFGSTRDAVLAGYRACKRCRPLEAAGSTPDWLRPLLEKVEEDPTRRWRDQDLRNFDLDPIRVRRWFQSHHGMTFHAYERSRRLGAALGRIKRGDELTATGFRHGFESDSGFRDAFERVFGTTPGKSRNGNGKPITMTRLVTPLGPMVAASVDAGVCMLEFPDRRMLETQLKRMKRWYGGPITPGDSDHLAQLDDELQRYFKGELTRFTVPLDCTGTEFQMQAWLALMKIPYGERRSYEQQARLMGRPGAQRAVGKANGDNRIAIVIPCHRVVRADGSLCGYGGGLWRKQKLLELESATH